MILKSPIQTVNIVTLGCSKNIVDSELLSGYLKNNGFRISHNSNIPSDIIIINTCGFINDAREESIDMILQYVNLKKTGKVKKVIVIGCLSERYKNELRKEIPEVDNYFGIEQYEEIVNYLKKDDNITISGKRILMTPSHYAYLKIAEGCNRKCSFCAIPLIKGKHRSKSIEDIVKEAEYLAKTGVKELILISQDLTYYGNDIYKKSMLYNLLKKLIDIEELDRIRLQYLYPADFPLEIIDLMNGSEKICRYIDIPLQHISDNILRSMKRGISRKGTIKLLENIKERLPEVALRTTLMVGYPGETDDDFNELKDFVSVFKFDRMGAFAYSEEEGTAAYHLKDNVPQDIKLARLDEIMRLQEQISFSKNLELKGKVLKVLIDRIETDYYIGRSEYDSPEVDNEVLINLQNNDLKVGNFYNVLITSAEPFDLFGKVV